MIPSPKRVREGLPGRKPRPQAQRVSEHMRKQRAKLAFQKKRLEAAKIANGGVTTEFWTGLLKPYLQGQVDTFGKDVYFPMAGDEFEKRQREMFQVARDALLAVEDSLRPGKTFGDAFDAHARVMDAAGHQQDRLNACGYSLGTTFAPNWMDWPMLYHGNPVEIAPGMTIFCHMIIFDNERGIAMTLGRTSLVTESGPECLSKVPLDLVSG